MKIDKLNAFVTGGAGFIGSNLVDKLVERGCSVKVYDNLSTGFKENLKQHENNPKVSFVVGDLLDFQKLNEEIKGFDIVFHFAANADLKKGIENTRRDLDQNTIATYNVLEAMRLNSISKIVFSSSSAVYGEPEVFPTPENYCPIQNSLYGASKQAGEGLIQAFGTMFGIQAWIYRFVSVVGERYSHGIVYDLVAKMRKNSQELEVMGDGTQRKSFVYVLDLVDAIFLTLEKAGDNVNVFNIGNFEYTTVTNAAKIISSEYGLPDVKFKYTGGKVGWKGDAPFVFLDISKIKHFGWTPNTHIEVGLRKTVNFLKENAYVYDKH